MSPRAAIAGDPSLVWKTIETRHFVIHYYEPLGDIARRVAAVAEHSHAVLAPVFDHEPDDKTHIVIVDDTDSANGFANVLPRNEIRLFATAPGSTSTLNDHDDWLYGLTAHEYTHILHLDSIRGLPRLVNKIIGKTWAPNQVQPRWIIEGIATYEESKRSSSGRTRSSLFDAELRAVTLAGTPVGLDGMSTGPRAWPHGNTPYLYGSHFLKYVFDRFGDDKLREMSWSYGSRAIPYGLNQSVAEVTGHGFEELYEDWTQHMGDRYAVQLEAIERAGRREGRRLTFSAEGNAAPRYTRDGELLVWQQSDGYSQRRFRAMPIGGDASAAREYARIERAGDYALLSDGSIVLDRSETYRSNYSYRDLFVWDRGGRALRRLTHGLRAAEPAVSPDGRAVAFVANGESQTRLMVMDLRPEARPRELWRGQGRWDQVSTPAWSPDGAHLAVSTWAMGGFRDIAVIDAATGRAERIARDRAVDVQPVFSPDGAYVYFASDRTGVYNIFAHERATGALWQVTNAVGGAIAPDVSPDGRRLAYQGFGVGGWDIWEIDLDPAAWTPALPYIDDRPVVEPIPDDVEVSAPRPYRPLETLAPQAYSLQLATDSFGTSVSAQTSGADVAGHHGYTMATAVGLARGDVSFAASYSYRRLWPTLRLTAARNTSRRGGLVIGGRNTTYVEDSYGASASLALPVLRSPEASSTFSIDYDIDWQRNVGDSYDGPDPAEPLPRFPETDAVAAGLALRWTYSDVDSFAYTLGPQQGQTFSASLRLDHPAFGSDFHTVSLSYLWQRFWKLPWGDTPVLAFRLAGGIRAADRRRVGSFSLGGVPRQDVVQSILDSARAGSTGYLRGFEPGAASGDQFHLANLEYRQMLWEIERGLSTLPVYVRRLHLAGLLDVGDAYSDGFDPRALNVGVGGAVRLDMVFGYFVPGSIDIGYARGLTAGGIGEYWLLLTGTL